MPFCHYMVEGLGVYNMYSSPTVAMSMESWLVKGDVAYSGSEIRDPGSGIEVSKSWPSRDW